MTSDTFERYADSPVGPARRASAVTPHDSNAISPLPKALFFGSAGTVTLRAVDSAADVSLPVAAGQILPVRASHVRASGTTAGNIVSLA